MPVTCRTPHARSADPRRHRRCPGRTRRPTPPPPAWAETAPAAARAACAPAAAAFASRSMVGLAGVTIAHQIRPSAPVDKLSGMPGRCSANGVTVPACGPVSQYFDSRRACSLGEHQRRTVRGQRQPVGEVQTRHQRQHGAVGIAPEQAAAPACLQDRRHVVGVRERARRLGEIDCAVGCFGDIRAEPQLPTVDLVDQRLELAGAGVHREQPARAVAHSSRPSRATCKPSGRPPVSPTTVGSPLVG